MEGIMSKFRRNVVMLCVLFLVGGQMGCDKSPVGPIIKPPHDTLKLALLSSSVQSVQYGRKITFSYMVQGDPDLNCSIWMDQPASNFEDSGKPRQAIAASISLDKTVGPGSITATYQAATTKWNGPVHTAVTCRDSRGSVTSDTVTINLVEPEFRVDSITPRVAYSNTYIVVRIYTSNCSVTSVNSSIGYVGARTGVLDAFGNDIADGTARFEKGCEVLVGTGIDIGDNTEPITIYVRRGDQRQIFTIPVLAQQ
jgi:hypothetical protein